VASGGYLGTVLATAAIGLATAVWQVGVLRALAWASRGLRSRRATHCSPHSRRGTYGRAFGVERAGDNLGAVAGPLLASLLVTLVGVRHAIYFSVIPGLFAAAAITLAAREAHRLHTSPGARQRARLNLGALPWSRWPRSSSATSQPPC
jgi:MFS family permease